MSVVAPDPSRSIVSVKASYSPAETQLLRLQDQHRRRRVKTSEGVAPLWTTWRCSICRILKDGIIYLKATNYIHLDASIIMRKTVCLSPFYRIRLRADPKAINKGNSYSPRCTLLALTVARIVAKERKRQRKKRSAESSQVANPWSEKVCRWDEASVRRIGRTGRCMHVTLELAPALACCFFNKCVG